MSEGGNSGDFYKPGDYNAVCDICGFRFKASKLKKNWKGEYVCEADFELRHPQEFIRVRPEKISVPWSRPESELFVFVCWIWARTAFADLGEADCMQADNITPSYPAAYALKYSSPDGNPSPPTIPPLYVCTRQGSTSFPSFATAGCMLPSNTVL